MFYGFADEGLLRQLESPSVMMVEGSDKPVAMKRSKVIEDKIEYLETSFQKVKALKETDETKEMLQNSRALYEYVMPVYKKEYMELAALYDQAAPPEQIQAYAKTIEDKYFLQYGQLYNKLITSGKSYAQKHNIKVNEVNPSPH